MLTRATEASEYERRDTDSNGTSLLARSITTYIPCRVSSVSSVSASRTVGREFTSRPGHTKTIIKMVQTASLHGTQCVRVGVGQCSPTV